MITTKNYFSKVENTDWSVLPEALSKGHKLVEGASMNNWAAYNSNDNIKRVVEAYFQKLDQFLKQNHIPEKKDSKESVPKKAAQKRSEKPAIVPQPKIYNYTGHKVEIRPYSKSSFKFIVWDIMTDQKFSNDKFNSYQDAKDFVDENKMTLIRAESEDQPESADAVLVERVDNDVQFIKRYANIHGKTKTQSQILNMIIGLQRAILEKRISKTSTYAKEIKVIQEQLIKAYEQMGPEVKITIAASSLKRYEQIGMSQQNMLSITLLKSYVGIGGKKGMKERASKLLKRMKNSVSSGRISKDDKYASRLNDACEKLKTFVNGKENVLSISKAELNGLDSLNVFDTSEEVDEEDELMGAEVEQILSSKELLGMKFETIGLQGKYRELIGDPSVGFSAMVFGLPKSGKSTFCLGFAKHLAVNHGKVLFCAVEEGFGYTLKEKVERLGVSDPRLFVSGGKIPSDLSTYDFVFIDSVSKAVIDLTQMETLRKNNPLTSFIFIYHTTKEGRFKGANTHAHEVDVIIEIGDGEARATGRFNAGGRIGL